MVSVTIALLKSENNIQTCIQLQNKLKQLKFNSIILVWRLLEPKKIEIALKMRLIA
jgi:hypothetical protein